MAIVSYQVARCEEARFGKQGVGPDGGTVVKGRQQLVLFFFLLLFHLEETCITPSYEPNNVTSRHHYQ